MVGAAIAMGKSSLEKLDLARSWSRLSLELAPRPTRRKARAGLFFVRSPGARFEPSRKRTVAFVDGQNLFFAARDAFGCSHPNYDALALSRKICEARGWELVEVRFYTGVPAPSDDARWHHFWVSKLRVMTWQGVHVYARPLRYRRRRLSLPDGTVHEYVSGEEKGIDVRIALDVIRMAHRDDYAVALVFSQDQDLSEVAGEIRTISHEQARWIKIACAYPVGPGTVNRRGIEKTDWIRINRSTYDTCLDRRDYRKKPRPTPKARE